MEVVFSSAVWEEVNTAIQYYEGEVVGLGKAFTQTLFESVQELKKYPLSSRIIKAPYHRYLLPRFPYGIIYRIEAEVIYIVAVAHLKRKPFYWLESGREKG